MGAGNSGLYNNTKGSKVSLPTKPAQVKHIFGNRTGHLLDAPANR